MMMMMGHDRSSFRLMDNDYLALEKKCKEKNQKKRVFLGLETECR